ncbi:MAG: histidine kinase [Nitrospira sp.]
MAPLAWFVTAPSLAGVMAAGMATVLFVQRRRSVFNRSLAGLLALVALANLADGIGLVDEAHALFWREVAMAAGLIQPAAVLYAGLAFLTPAESSKQVSPVWRARIIGIGGGIMAVVTITGFVFQWEVAADEPAAMSLTSWGRVAYVFIVIGMALGLAQLELILRASREPFRHKLKFIVIGLGGLAGYQIYEASQMLLFPIWQAEQVVVSSIVTFMALCLIAHGLRRSRLREALVHAYVSHQALVGSVTFIIIGLYLLTIGTVGSWLREANHPLGVGLSVVVTFTAIVGLVVAAFSKTVRAEIRRFITRNFHRSKYDYRMQWLQTTEAFQGAADKNSIMDRLLDVLIKTFLATEVSIWSFRQADQRFCLVRSMTGKIEPEPIEQSHPIVTALRKRDSAVWVEPQATGTQDRFLVPTDPLRTSGVALCFPIRTQGHVIAFISLGPQLRGALYGTDDEDLLRGIAHHVGMLLSHATLTEDRQASAELEALHRFAVFCVHDLKNLAARLSLVAQNAERHGRDPAFQESAMRTVKDSAFKMVDLMSKLSLRSVKPPQAGTPEPVDLSAVLNDIIAPMKRDPTVRLSVTGAPVPPIMAVRDQIHQLLLNVVLNAKQAVGGNGQISVALAQHKGSVIVTVDDTGGGIPPVMLESLFRPSQSGRPGGLGIGLYQCRQIVEAHQGTIQVRSEVGKGTHVRIELPVCQSAGNREKSGLPHPAMSVPM